VTPYCLESSQVRKRNDCCRFPAKVDHLIRTKVTVWLRRHSGHATGLLRHSSAQPAYDPDLAERKVAEADFFLNAMEDAAFSKLWTVRADR
jgi:hypothetical protein